MSDAQNLTFSGHFVPYNYSLWYDPALCTLETCPKSYATIKYLPSLSGNAFFLTWFSAIFLVQLALGIWKHTWTFLVAMVSGCLLEMVGYAARISMHANIFDFNRFLMLVTFFFMLCSVEHHLTRTRYLIVLTIAPCFFTAAIYLTLTRLIVLHGPHLARFKPRIYTIVFITWDVISLALQGAGGGLADTGNDDSGGQTGINIMIAGLSSQVASLVAFMLLCADFAWRCRGDRNRVADRTFNGLSKMGGSMMAWTALVCGKDLGY